MENKFIGNKLILFNIGIIFIFIFLILKQHISLILKINELENDQENLINNWSEILANLKKSDRS